MATTLTPKHFADRLTSRGGAWVTLGSAILIMMILFGIFAGAKAPARTGQAPADAESTRVAELMQQFPGADEQAVLVVASRDGGGTLSAENLDALAELLPVIGGERTARGPSHAAVNRSAAAAT